MRSQGHAQSWSAAQQAHPAGPAASLHKSVSVRAFTPHPQGVHASGSVGCLPPALAGSSPVLNTQLSLLPLQWACMAPAALAGTTLRLPASSPSRSARQLPSTQASCAVWGRSLAQRCELWAPTSARRQSVSGEQHWAMLQGWGHGWPLLSLMLLYTACSRAGPSNARRVNRLVHMATLISAGSPGAPETLCCHLHSPHAAMPTCLKLPDCSCLIAFCGVCDAVRGCPIAQLSQLSARLAAVLTLLPDGCVSCL